MTRYIPYGRQDITQADIDAVTEVLRSDFITQGPAVERFEQSVADHCGIGHAVALSSATAALHVACHALGLGPGDWLWTSPNTFVASANCGLYCSANVDFVDIDPNTLNIDPVALRAKLERARADKRLPRVVVAVHFAGLSCPMQQIAALSREFGFSVIEDASHAIGASYQGAPVGTCQYSDICVFSFHPVKIVTTGEGGVAVTRDETLARRMTLGRTHGITRDAQYMHSDSHGPWYYEQIDTGWNYRITDIQAALGASQMSRLTRYIDMRQHLAARYDELLRPLPVILPSRSPDAVSAYHLYPIRVDPARTNAQRRQVFDAMRAAKVGVNVHYIPVHLQPVYRQMGFNPGDYPHAEHYYAHAISLPMYATLAESDQLRVVQVLENAIADGAGSAAQ